MWHPCECCLQLDQILAMYVSIIRYQTGKVDAVKVCYVVKSESHIYNCNR